MKPFRKNSNKYCWIIQLFRENKVNTTSGPKTFASYLVFMNSVTRWLLGSGLQTLTYMHLMWRDWPMGPDVTLADMCPPGNSLGRLCHPSELIDGSSLMCTLPDVTTAYWLHVQKGVIPLGWNESLDPTNQWTAVLQYYSLFNSVFLYSVLECTRNLLMFWQKSWN